MKKTPLFLCLLAVLLACTQTGGEEGSTTDAPGTLQLHVSTPSMLAGSYSKDGMNLMFTSRPSALNLLVDGVPLLSFINYGAFMRVHLTDAVFLMANEETAKGVIDISSIAKKVVLPNIDTSVVHNPDENIAVFRALIAQYSTQELVQSQAHMSSLLGQLVHQPEAAMIPYLSIKLASIGISSITHPSALPIHMPALRIAKLRDDIKFDASLLQRVNRVHNARSPPTDVDGCELSDTCNNACFGRCGEGCSCWSWVCGSCDCFRGCWQHDCCCSCEGRFSLCCLNVVSVRCAGYANSCQPPAAH